MFPWTFTHMAALGIMAHISQRFTCRSTFGRVNPPSANSEEPVLSLGESMAEEMLEDGLHRETSLLLYLPTEFGSDRSPSRCRSASGVPLERAQVSAPGRKKCPEEFPDTTSSSTMSRIRMKTLVPVKAESGAVVGSRVGEKRGLKLGSGYLLKRWPKALTGQGASEAAAIGGLRWRLFFFRRFWI
jgi:hypothetical protein